MDQILPSEVEGPASYGLEQYLLNHLRDVVGHAVGDRWGEIQENDFDKVMKTKYAHTHADFFREHVDGHPRTLLSISREVEDILRQMKDSPRWQLFRDMMGDIIRETKHIKSAVCLGLARLTQLRGTETGDVWLYQYSAFTHICNMIDEKQVRENLAPVSRIFQDPDFDLRTEYVIQEIPRDLDAGPKEITKHPNAFDAINEESFTFGVHLTVEMWEEVLREAKHPQLLITNNAFGVGGWHHALYHVLFEEICRNKRLVPDRKLKALVEQFRTFERTHARRVFSHVGSLDAAAVFQGTWVYWKMNSNQGSHELKAPESSVTLREPSQFMGQKQPTVQSHATSRLQSEDRSQPAENSFWSSIRKTLKKTILRLRCGTKQQHSDGESASSSPPTEMSS